MLEECADNLEKAVDLLHSKVRALESVENTNLHLNSSESTSIT